MKSPILLCIGLLIVLVQACDILGEDDVATPSLNQINQSIEKQYMTLPSSAVLIDITGKIQTNNSLTLKLKEQPKRGSITLLQQGILQYVPYEDFKQGKDAIVYQIISQNNSLLEDSISIIVTPDSTALPCPSLLPNQFTVPMNTTTNMWVLLNDRLCVSSPAELDSASLTVIQAPQHGVATVQHRAIAYTPDPGYEGVDQLIYQVCSTEDESLCKMALVSINVSNNCNQAKTDYQRLDVGVAYTLDVLANDELCIPRENISLHLESPLPPEIKAFVTQDKQIELQLLIPIQDSLAIKYSLCDPKQQCSEAFIFIRANDATVINPVGCTFDLHNDNIILSADTLNQYRLDVFANDEICWEQDFTVGVAQPSVHGSLWVEDNQLIYQPHSKAYRGYDSLYYQLCLPAADTSCQQARVILEIR